ncbi:MAG: DNA repair protein RadA [Luteibaculaceae bacterium]
MAKVKTAYFCQSCGNQFSQWMGKCPACGAWNSIVEEKVVTGSSTGKIGYNATIGSADNKKNKPKPIQQISSEEKQRIVLNDAELNRVLGGGIVPGSLTLIGGEPGIGKSTLTLQIALKNKFKVLYVSGEESEEQIKMRANRVKDVNENCFVISETDLELIFLAVQEVEPTLVIIDSIQTISSSIIESSPGSVSQVRECTAQFIKMAKTSGIAVILIGHITKDGSLAGPKVLEHMVDAVLLFEGDQNYVYRLLRGQKNRFGSTNELGIYEMAYEGLKEVSNPSELLINQFQEDLSGTAVACTLEGIRPLLIEIQALVSSAVYGTPQRSATGFDLRRLNMLLAVLEKRCGFRLGTKDVFLNIAGGLKVSDPAIDLAVVMAILSSSNDVAIPKNNCFAAEVGLSGELRPINRIEQRIQEAEKLGFDTIYIARNAKNPDRKRFNIRILEVAKVEEIYRLFF